MTESNNPQKLSAAYSRVLNASATRIFEAWINPEWLQQWFAPFSKKIARIEINPQLGGHYRIEMEDDGDGGRILEGEYLEFNRPRRLVFTWTNYLRSSGVPRAVDSIVTVDLTPTEDDHTELHIVHEGFVDDVAARIHQQSWESGIDKLEAALRG